MDFNSIDSYNGVEELWKERIMKRKLFKKMFINKVPNFYLINRFGTIIVHFKI